MKLWVESFGCHSHAHCGACRSNRRFRESLFNRGLVDQIDFECPFGYSENKLPPRKLGDRIAAIAHPIARKIDRLTRGKTKLIACGGCKKMQTDLNAGMSFGRALRNRLSPEHNI